MAAARLWYLAAPRQLAFTRLTAAFCWLAVGAATQGTELAIFIPGSIRMLVSGMVMAPAGEVVASLTGEVCAAGAA